MSEQNVSTPKWSLDNSIYEKDKFFVFKKSNIDKKNGISIKKFKSKKEFTKHLSEFDYVEERKGDVLYTKAHTAPLEEAGWKSKKSIRDGMIECFKNIDKV